MKSITKTQEEIGEISTQMQACISRFETGIQPSNHLVQTTLCFYVMNSVCLSTGYMTA
ncbi:hypothetical protein [Candidatus Liberibacter americanus]|uniref:hypothetical protein n=1 Tax=Candidatus Liberibacter americanus TaxID=309868 RepID=UPI0016519C3A|nr:hypothetical protein [Candidatus Liberibacter americanus]